MQKLWSVLVCSLLVCNVAVASCWSANDKDGKQHFNLTIHDNVGSITQTETQASTNRCSSLVQDALESLSCYDDYGSVSVWLIVPDRADRNTALATMLFIPVFDYGKEMQRSQFTLSRCIST